MDSYGIFRNTKEDYDQIVAEFFKTGSIVFAYSANGVDCMIVHIDGAFRSLGTMPFGGNPHDRLYVGIYGKGCGHLGVADIAPSYIAEKLKLGSYDSGIFSDFWKEFSSRLAGVKTTLMGTAQE